MMRVTAWVALLPALMLSATLAHGTESPDDARLARAAARCTGLAELISCYDALNRRPNDPALLIAEADALMQLKRPGEAIGVYRNAATLGADRVMVEARIGAASALRRSLLDLCRTQQGAPAERACESAWLPGAADEVTVFKRRGSLLQADNQPSAALDAYLAAARLAPRDRVAAHAIIALAATTGRNDRSTQLAVIAAKSRLRAAERLAAANVQSTPTSTPNAGDPSEETATNVAEVTRSN